MSAVVTPSEELDLVVRFAKAFKLAQMITTRSTFFPFTCLALRDGRPVAVGTAAKHRHPETFLQLSETIAGAYLATSLYTIRQGAATKFDVREGKAVFAAVADTINDESMQKVGALEVHPEHAAMWAAKLEAAGFAAGERSRTLVINDVFGQQVIWLEFAQCAPQEVTFKVRRDYASAEAIDGGFSKQLEQRVASSLKIADALFALGATEESSRRNAKTAAANYGCLILDS